MSQSLPPEQAEVDLRGAIEGVLLVAGAPVSVAALAAAVDAPRSSVLEALAALTARREGGIRVQVHEGHAQLVSAPECMEAVHRFLGSSKLPGLSRSALECLSVIAYRQPVTRSEIEAARGVNSDRAVQTLVARGLIEERGRRPSIGHPTEYGTTFAFLEYFGLSSLDDLPPLPEWVSDDGDVTQLGLRPAESD